MLFHLLSSLSRREEPARKGHRLPEAGSWTDIHDHQSTSVRISEHVLTASRSPSEFSTFGGQSDFLIGGLASGSQGCVAAFSNVFPKTIKRIYDLYTQGKTEEALALHRKAALAESPVKAGMYLLNTFACSCIVLFI